MEQRLTRAERRAMKQARALVVREVVERHAKSVEYKVGFLHTAAQELDWEYKKLSHVLTTHVHLRKWWTGFKETVKKERRKARRARARERAIALGRNLLY